MITLICSNYHINVVIKHILLPLASVPVARMLRAPCSDVHPVAERERHGAGFIGAPDSGAHVHVSLQHVGTRMVVSVAVSQLKNCVLRLYRRQEAGCR